MFTNPGLARQGWYTGYSPSSTGEGEARTHAEHTDSERLPSEGVLVRTTGEMSRERATRALPNTAQERGEGCAHRARRPAVAAEPRARSPAPRRPLGAGRCQRCEGSRGRCHQRAPCATGQEGPGGVTELAGSAALPGASPAREGSAAPGERGRPRAGPGDRRGARRGQRPGGGSGEGAGREAGAGGEGGREGGRPAGGEPGGTGAHEAPTRAVAAILTMGRW